MLEGIRKLLRPGGRFADLCPGYECREEQIEMAEAVACALVEKNHLLVEAGTGVGKTVAYLIPAVLHAAEPNPFNPRTQIRFEVPGTAGGQVPTSLDVYDLKGRLVRRLHVGPLAPGTHVREWDGTDTQSSAVASGVYFIEMRTDGFRDVHKAILLK